MLTPQSGTLHADAPNLNAHACDVFITRPLSCTTSPLFTTHTLPIPYFTASLPAHVLILHIPSSCLDNFVT
jgi:hypothetical protein